MKMIKSCFGLRFSHAPPRPSTRPFLSWSQYVVYHVIHLKKSASHGTHRAWMDVDIVARSGRTIVVVPRLHGFRRGYTTGDDAARAWVGTDGGCPHDVDIVSRRVFFSSVSRARVVEKVV